MIVNYSHVSTPMFYSTFSTVVNIGDEVIEYSVPSDLIYIGECDLGIVSDWRVLNDTGSTGEI